MNIPVSVQFLWPALLLAGIPALFWLNLRGPSRLSRGQLVVATILRSGAILCVAVALMQPRWNGAASDVSVVYALDVSRSISPSFIESAVSWIERADREGTPARSRVVAFADHPVLLDRAVDIRAVPVAEGPVRPAPAEIIDQAQTNLERALDMAVSSLDPDRAKRIVLLTDGNQTTGDVWRALPGLKRAAVRVFPIPAKMRDAIDAWIAGIDLPVAINAGEPVSVAVRVVSTMQVPSRVSLHNAKALLGTRKVMLQAGSNRVVFETRLAHQGNVTLSAEVEALGDSIEQNNRLQQTVWVGARPRILYVEGGAPGDSRFLAAALAGQGIDARVIEPAALPASAEELTAYAAVVLSDTPARAITAESMRAVERYVCDFGGGLLFAGGENVHGEQGYSDTAIERVLPVEFRAQEKRKDLTMVVALDRSYSMKGRKMEMAKEATRAALDLLEEQHRFAVVAFDSQPYIAVPMQFVRSRRKAQDQISRIQASGQTNIYPALGIVYRLLQKVESKAKHVVLLSDGDTHPADFETLVKRMAGEKIVLSTVAVGADADRELMADIARWGKGRAYVTENADTIPQIFIEETERAVRSNLLEESFRPTLKRRSASFRGIDAGNLPDLRGLVSSKSRDHAEVLLSAPSGTPPLVRWQYGLGKSVAFTSDVKSRWAPDWIRWHDYGKFWAQQIRDVMRRESGESLDFRVSRDADEGVIRLSSLTSQGTFRDGLAPKVRITHADGSSSTIVLAQTGAGIYEARVALDRTSKAERFDLIDTPGLPASRASSRILHRDFSAEYRALPPDMDLLENLARATGGKVAPTIAEIFDQNGDQSRASRELWRWFAMLGLVFYLLDIAVRRSPLAWRTLGA